MRLTMAIAAALLLASHVNASEEAMFKGKGIRFVARHGIGPIPIIKGDNFIGKPKVLECKSTRGCIIELNYTIRLEDVVASISCVQIDGQSGNPSCLQDAPEFTHQTAIVGQGPHTLQMDVYSYNDGGDVTEWQADYTLYERKERGQTRTPAPAN